MKEKERKKLTVILFVKICLKGFLSKKNPNSKVADPFFGPRTQGMEVGKQYLD